MNKLNFKITINAPVDKVFRVMIDDQSYREWTKAFNGTSHYVGSWEKGEKIVFIGLDEQGNKCGMVSRIKENIPNRMISIEHLGMLEGGKEITEGEKVESWAGALENYYFNDNNGSTELSVEMDSNEDFESYFKDTWPKALDTLKALCE